MRLFRIPLCLSFFFVAFAATVAAGERRDPVSPDFTPEAQQLLDYLYAISGHRTLVGQHNQPLFEDVLTIDVAGRSRDQAAIYGQDFGYSPRGTLDDITLRQENINKIIRAHQAGSIITLMWHAVRPIDQEPGTWQETVQAHLTADQWHDLVTPGTEINERWQAQVDVIAWFLEQLQREHIPVLWRPYHEMNGGWFWWGHRRGPDGYVKLWRMLFDRLTRFHRLHNLIWVWNANEVDATNKHPYAWYYPGGDVVDVLATDVYRANFDPVNYTDLLVLGEGRPIALGEVGPFPSEQVLAEQPRWAWFMAWSTMAYGNDPHLVTQLYRSERTFTRSEVDLTQRTFPPVASPAAGAGAELPPLDERMPADFVYVDNWAATVVQELRYATAHNFVGAPIDGYGRGRAILTKPAALALRAAQAELQAEGEGYGLKLFDAYRPQRAVNHFVRWARDPAATAMQAEFYPTVPKTELFARGYIALASGHSRGSTVDLTLVRRGSPMAAAGEEIDMGTPFDFFGPASAAEATTITATQRANREKLRALMVKHGFEPYAAEWWHFTLRGEPYPDTYFDFPIN